jgi:hypothetical protein
MRRYEILLGFLLGTAVWVVVIVLQSDASLLHQICETNPYTEHENCTPHHILYVALYYIGYAINPVTLGAAATVAIAVFTYTLYDATRGLVRAAEIQSADMKRSIVASENAASAAKKSAESGEKALVLAYKPMLTIQELGLREPTGGVEQFHIHWGIRNSGQGVTVVKWMTVSTIIVEKTQAGKRRITSSQRREWLSAIEPKETVSGHAFTTPTIHHRIEAIKCGKLALYVIFEIEDEDATFRNVSTSRFPFVFEAPAGSFRRINMNDVDSAGGATSTENQEKTS